MSQEQPAIRLLLVDDEENILELYQKVLQESQRQMRPGRMGQLAAQLFGRKVDDDHHEPKFELTFARQATEAVEAVEKALTEGRPYAVAFMDIRMPPGEDGVWAAERIREMDPMIEIILVTGFSDIDPKEIARRVQPLDKLLYIEKPFFPQEIRHFASSLGAKWSTERELHRIKNELEQTVKERTNELEESNRRLLAEISEHERTEALREFRGGVLERIVAGDSLREVVHTLTTGIEYVRPGLSAVLLLANPSGERLDVIPTPGLPQALSDGLVDLGIAKDAELCGQAAYRGETLYASFDGEHEFDRIAYAAEQTGFKSATAVPISFDARVKAVMVVFCQEARQLSAFEERLLKSARQLATVALERSSREAENRKLLAAVEQNPTGILICDLRGHISYVNKGYMEQYGGSRESLIGSPCSLLTSDPNSEERLETLRKERWWEEERETTYVHGGTCYEQVVMSVICDQQDEPSHILVVCRDITQRKLADDERRNLESKLLQAQKMETIGTLAGGIAHDFNNMLTPILGYSEMAMVELEEDEPTYEYIEHILHASSRAKELVQQMLTFSRRGQSEQEPLQIHQVANEAVKLVRSSLPSTIRIQCSIEDGVGTVMANPTQMIQVLMNLSANAKHAINKMGGGTLSISLEKRKIPEDVPLGHRTLDSGEYAYLSVKDTGHGIDEDNLARIFEPFFTTKGAGEGTGLGLSVVHGIVIGHRGDIFVDSELGKGTTFHIYLPLSDAVPLEAVEGEAIARGAEHLLFVDDEEMIVHMTRSMLERQGYEVTACSDPLEAFDEIMRDPEAFDLVITDQTMPNMTGVELAGRIMALRPDLPVILLTGFSETVSEENCKDLGIQEFLMKPMSTNELSSAIRSVLDRTVVG